jgi:hypothetical protein
MAYVQIIPNKGVSRSGSIDVQNNFAPNSSIANGKGKFATYDLFLFERFRGFWDLTSDLWAEFDENSCKCWRRRRRRVGTAAKCKNNGKLRGSLRFATDDEAVCCSGRDDATFC